MREIIASYEPSLAKQGATSVFRIGVTGSFGEAQGAHGTRERGRSGEGERETTETAAARRMRRPPFALSLATGRVPHGRAWHGEGLAFTTVVALPSLPIRLLPLCARGLPNSLDRTPRRPGLARFRSLPLLLTPPLPPTQIGTHSPTLTSSPSPRFLQAHTTSRHAASARRCSTPSCASRALSPSAPTFGQRRAPPRPYAHHSAPTAAPRLCRRPLGASPHHPTTCSFSASCRRPPRASTPRPARPAPLSPHPEVARAGACVARAQTHTLPSPLGQVGSPAHSSRALPKRKLRAALTFARTSPFPFARARLTPLSHPPRPAGGHVEALVPADQGFYH